MICSYSSSNLDDLGFEYHCGDSVVCGIIMNLFEYYDWPGGAFYCNNRTGYMQTGTINDGY